MDRHLQQGELVHLPDGDYEVIRGVGASALLRRLDDGVEAVIGLHDLPVWVGETLLMRDPRFDPVLLTRLSAADRTLVQSRLRAVHAVLGQLPSDDDKFADYDPDSTTVGQRIDRQVVARREANLPACPNSLRNWKGKYMSGGLLALRDLRSARKKKPFGKTDKRILDVIDEVLEEYSTKSDTTDKLLLKVVRDRARVRHEHDDEPLTIPSDRTLRRRLAERRAYARTKGTARQRRTQAKVPDRMFARRPVLFPGQEGQSDTSPFDVLHVNRHGKKVRGKVTFLLDVATRIRSGIVVTEGPPTGRDHAFMLLSSLTTTVVSAGPVLPWTVDLSKYEWAQGWTPEDIRAAIEQQPFISTTRVHIDNARDYQSHDVQGVADSLGVDLSFANPRTPTDKPEIERQFGSLWTLLIEDLPGYISFGTEHRGDEPDASELLDVYTLTAVLQAWIVIRWNNRPHAGLRDPITPGVILTPAQMYDVMFEHTGLVPLALSRDEFISYLPFKRLVCRPDGFHINYRRYDSERVTFRGEPCPYTEDGKWPVHYNPSNPLLAWVADPDSDENGQFIELEWQNHEFFLQPYNKPVRDGARQIATRFGLDRDPSTVENINRLLGATDKAIEHADREQDRADTNAALSDQLGLQIPGPVTPDPPNARDQGNGDNGAEPKQQTNGEDKPKDQPQPPQGGAIDPDDETGIFNPFEEDW